MGMEWLLTEFVNNSNVGLGIVDRELRYQALNPRLAEMNGMSVESHLGKTLRDVLGEVALQVEPAIKRVFETGQPIFNFMLSGTVPTRAEPTSFVDHLLPLRDARGRVRHVGAVVVEVQPTMKPQPGSATHASASSPSSRNEILRSWKEIANYVGTCVKTVQRWEHQFNFPVRRLERTKGAVVFALKAEVDSWIQMRTRRAS